MPEIQKISENVFYDTAASPFLYDYRIYEVALKIIGEDRILFGSDYPLLPPRRYFKEMEAAFLAKKTQNKIKGEKILGQYELARIWRRDKQSGEWRKTGVLRKKQPPQILFIERCLQFLKPGGRMVISDIVLTHELPDFIKNSLKAH